MDAAQVEAARSAWSALCMAATALGVDGDRPPGLVTLQPVHLAARELNRSLGVARTMDGKLRALHALAAETTPRLHPGEHAVQSAQQLGALGALLRRDGA